MNNRGMRINDTVLTPNGVGIVQGRLVENGEPGRILVSHDPGLPTLPEDIRAQSQGGPWVLHAYEPDQVQLYTAPMRKDHRRPTSSAGVNPAAGGKR